jgi:hypothetical protein
MLGNPLGTYREYSENTLGTRENEKTTTPNVSKVVCHHFCSKLMARAKTILGHSQPSYSLDGLSLKWRGFFFFLSFWLAHHPKKLTLARLLKIVISMWAWSASRLVHLNRREGENFEQSMSLQEKNYGLQLKSCKYWLQMIILFIFV